MTNSRGGKNFKRSKKHNGDENKKTDIPLAENPSQRYASVLRRLGGKRVQVICSDSETRQGLIPGSFYKKVWLNQGDIVLVEVSEFNSKECHIIYKYDQSDARNLRTKGLIKFEEKENGEQKDIIFGDELNEDDEDATFNELQKSEEDPEDASKTPKDKEKITRKAVKKDKEQSRNNARDKKTDKSFDIDSI